MRYKTKCFINTILLLLGILNSGCTEKPTQPGASSTDTTSHDFIWRIDTLGMGNGSTVYDVAIVNDTLVYAVGEFFLRDPSGTMDHLPYGLAIWNGNGWRFRRIYARYQNIDGHLEPRGVLAFSPTDVWFAWGDVFRWDGTSDTAKVYLLEINSINPAPVLGPNQAIYKLWGSSGSDIWGVGSNGAIVHFDGSHWTKVESGTALPILDVWGGHNNNNGNTEVLAIASNDIFGEGKKLFSLKNNIAVPLPDSGLISGASGIWFDPGKKYYAADGLLRMKTNVFDTTQWANAGNLTIYHINFVRGTSMNDVIIGGAYGALLHYNGNSWRTYPELFINGSLFRADKKGLLTVIGGSVGNSGVVIIGKHL